MAPLTLLVGAIVFNLVILRAETTPVNTLNDTGMHAQMVRWARGQIDEGRVPLDGWFPNLGLGSPHFHHYQSLPHTVAAYVSKAFGVERTFTWVLYILLSLWPLSIYWGGRIAGWSRWTSATMALVSPLLASSPAGHGFEHGSYVFRGYGMWAQLWGMWLLPLAWASSWRAVRGNGSKALGALAVGLTLSVHFLTGYQALLAIGIWVLVKPSEFLRRLGRAAAVGIGAALVSAWAIVPLIGDSAWANQSVYQRGTFFNDSFGARKVLGWLVTGELFDAGRFPVVTLLLAVGIVVCVARFRRDERCRAALCIWILATLLFFGRPTLGPLVDLLPGSGDLLLHRFISGVHLAGILLAGVGASWLAGAVFRQARRRLPQIRALAPVAVVILALIVLVPPYKERAAFAGENARQIRIQQLQDRRDGVDLVALIDQAKVLGGGRIYAGLRSNWGAEYRVGYVPVYSVLAFHDADQVGFTLRTASLSADIETLFDETNPQHYDLFNVRYLILPADRKPSVTATLVAKRGRHTLWRTETSGYMQVVDTTGSIPADRTNLAAAMSGFLASDQLAKGLYPVVAFDGDLGATPTTIGDARPAGSPGRVDEQSAWLDDGFFAGRVTADRTAVVLLKASYDPRWTVQVDGSEQTPEMIAPSYVGVVVPPGSHYVAFHYRPYSSYPVLFALGVLALVGLARLPRIRVPRGRELLGVLAITAVATAAVVTWFTASTSGAITQNEGCGFDGIQYCVSASGGVPRAQFSRRILAPAIVRVTTPSHDTQDIIARFRQLNVVSLIVVALGTVVLTRRVARRIGVQEPRARYASFIAGSLVATASMGFHFSIFYPVLTDNPALALGLVWIIGFTDDRSRVRWLSVPMAFLTVITREAWILPIFAVLGTVLFLRRSRAVAHLAGATALAVVIGAWLGFTAPSSGQPFPESWFATLWMVNRTSILTSGGVFNLIWMLLFGLGFVPLLLLRKRRLVRPEFRHEARITRFPLLWPILVIIAAHTVISLPTGGDLPRLLFQAVPFVFALAIAHVARFRVLDVELALCALASLVLWRVFTVLPDSTDAYFRFFSPVWSAPGTQSARILDDGVLVALPLLAWIAVARWRRRTRANAAPMLEAHPPAPADVLTS